MRGVQRLAGLGDDLNRFVHVEFAPAFHLVTQRIPLHVFADEVGAGVRQHSEIEDSGDLRMSEIEGDLRFEAKAILSSRIGDRARAYDFDGDFLPGFVRRHKDCARSAMIDHTLQPVAHVDHVGDRLDVPQLDKAVAAKLEVRRITLFARHAFTRDFVRIVDGHGVISLSDTGLMGLIGLIGSTGRRSTCLLISRSLCPSLPPSLHLCCSSSQPEHSVSTRRASPA